MESNWIADILVRPLSLGLLAGVVLASVAALYLRDDAKAPMHIGRLATGYAGAMLMCFCVAAALSYVSKEEAIENWHVLAEDYWPVLLTTFRITVTLLIYFVVLGIAVIGAPVIFAMARRGWGTVPLVLLASLPISLIFLSVVMLLSKSKSEAMSSSLLRNAPEVMGMHLVLALGFSVGARLPWKRAP